MSTFGPCGSYAVRNPMSREAMWERGWFGKLAEACRIGTRSSLEGDDAYTNRHHELLQERGEQSLLQVGACELWLWCDMVQPFSPVHKVGRMVALELGGGKTWRNQYLPALPGDSR